MKGVASGMGPSGTVVEGQIDGLLVTIHSPIGFRIKPPQVYGGLLYKHLLYFRIYDLFNVSTFGLIDTHQTLQLLFLLVSLFLADRIL